MCTGRIPFEAGKAKPQALLEPRQVAVGTAGGCEAKVHVARQWFHGHASDQHRDLVELGLASAFSSIDRQDIFVAVRTRMPQCARWLGPTQGIEVVAPLGDARASLRARLSIRSPGLKQRPRPII